MRTIALFFILFCDLYSQYTLNDSELIKTTFTKEFNPGIINEYLSSSEKQKVIASLLSIAHSKDTNWVTEITKLNFDTYGKHIAFAIGQIGYSVTGIRFLEKKIYGQINNLFIPDLLESLGKTGDKKSYDRLLEYLSEDSGKHLEGFPYALYNFHQRDFINDYSVINKLLIKELSATDEKSTFDALFGFQRIFIDISSAKQISEFLLNNHRILSVRNKCYALSAMRKVDSLIISWDDLKIFVVDSDWRVRTEAAKLAAKYGYKNEEEIKIYFSLLNDSNSNVARQAAISLKDIKLSSELKTYFIAGCEKLLNDINLSINTHGEIFVSITDKKFGMAEYFFNKYKNVIDKKYLLASLKSKSFSAEVVLNFLMDEIEIKTVADRMDYLDMLLVYQRELCENQKYTKYIMKELNSDEPVLISMICNTLDSLFISNHKNELIGIITTHIDTHLNKTEFAEALTSLHYIAQKIDETFSYNVLEKFADSSSDDLVRYYHFSKNKTVHPKSEDIFSEIGDKFFKYQKAVVSTDAGDFKMVLRPDIAPVSVGNFCYLSENHFFDKIIFHRVVPNFVAQTGDPSSTGWGGPGYTINSELSPTLVKTSMVGMASSGQDTEGSQWFIMHNDYPHLYGRYTIFAEVVDGMEVIDKLEQHSIIKNITLLEFE